MATDWVGARGFEPPTSCSQSRRATGLRYAPWTPTSSTLSLRSNQALTYPISARSSGSSAATARVRWDKRFLSSEDSSA